MFYKKRWYKIIFRLLKQSFIALLSVSRSLATKSASLNNKACMIRFTLIDSNPVELNFICSWLVYVNTMDFVMFLMTYLEKYMIQVQQKTNVELFIW